MGVGVRNTPTPIYIKEDTESQKQINLNENDINIKSQKANQNYYYNVPLDFNIPTTSVSTGSQSSQYSFINRNVFRTTTIPNRQIRHWVNSAKKFSTNNTSPYTEETIQKESRILEQVESQDGTTIYSTTLSTSNFYNNWQYSAWSTKLTTTQNTISTELKYNSQFNLLAENVQANIGIEKTIRITTKAFIGNDETILNVHNDLKGQVDDLNEAYNYLEARVQNYQTVIKTYDFNFQLIPQETKLFTVDIGNTYTAAIQTSNPTCVIEFAKMEMLNGDENLFYDGAYFLYWKQQGQTTPTTSNNQLQLQSYINYTQNNGGSFTANYTTATIIQEIVDIPGIMWQILSMPFTFISTAFNLTLFPGTPYQVNISNLLLTVFGVLVFVFIFKLILKK